MLLSSEPFCVHELFGLPDHIDQAGAAQGAGAGADVAPRRSPTRLESNVTAKAGGVADLKTCDEFKKRVQQAVPEISGTCDNHCERERKRRGQNQNIDKSPEDRP